METYRIELHNPSANPEEHETRYVYADDKHEAELQALDIIAGHPFSDVELVEVARVSPEDLYHEST